MTKKRKIIVLTLSVTVAATTLMMGVHPASADSFQNQINQVHNKQEQQRNKLDQVKAKEAATLQKVKKLESQIADTGKQISTVKANQEETQKKITALEKKITETQKRIMRRDELLKDRVRLMYTNGSTVHYMEVLLGSQSFNDFLSRVFALHLIAKQDKQLLDAQKADMKKEEKDKARITKTINQLQDQLDSLNSLKAELKNKTEEVKALLDQLKGKGSAIEETIQAEQVKVKALLKKQIEAERKAAEKRAVEEKTAEQKVEQQSHTNGQDNDTINQSGARSQKDTNTQGNTNHQSRSNTTNERYNAPSSSSGGSDSASGSVQDMVEAGRKWIGNSVYVFGGGRNSYDIRNGIFDCSSFIHWEFQQIGVNVGWTTTALSQEGQVVSPSNMKPGDLVFFDTYKKNGHVAIYIGSGKFIDAENSYGVRITSFDNPYWSAHFNGLVRRIL